MSVQIPKIIHYCWFGGNPKPELIVKCIESWHKYLPDYEIREWNESNFDVNFCKFSADAYAAKKWAFVSDVARLKLIYDHGGIYMDTDVELRSASQFSNYLAYDAFFFFAANVGVNTGVGFGGKAGDPLLKDLLDSYLHITFTPDDLHPIACPALNTPVIQEKLPTFAGDFHNQIIGNYAFISEADYWKFAHHYGAFSWRNEEQDYALQFAHKTPHVSKFRHALRSPSIFRFFKKYQLRRTEKIYTFLVYDLFDYGIVYWLVRLKCKILKSFKKSPF